MHPRSAAASLAARSLLGRTPHLRTHIYHNARPRLLRSPQARCVSTEEALAKVAEHDPIMSALANGCLNVSWGMLEILHNFGLPWALALPAAAVVVRAAIMMPLFQIPARKAQQASADLIPLSRAYMIVKKHHSHRLYYGDGPRVARSRAMRLVTKYNYQLRKRWNAERWRQMLPFAGLPVFVTVAEVIRRMAGARSGLWGLIFGQPSTEESKTAKALSEGANPDGAADGAADGSADVLEMVVQQGQGTTSLPSSVPDTAILSSWLEPSFATEGMLWFPNLMLPDPLMILPFAVSGVTMASLWRGSKPPAQGKEKPSLIVLKRILMTVALAIGPMTLNMPAGILLYWLSSTSCAFLAHVYLDWKYPLRMPPKPCKRSMMYYPKKKKQGVAKR